MKGRACGCARRSVSVQQKGPHRSASPGAREGWRSSDTWHMRVFVRVCV